MQANNMQDLRYNNTSKESGGSNDSTNQIFIDSSTWSNFSASGVGTDGPTVASTTAAIEPEVGMAQMPELGLCRRHSQRNPRSCDFCRARKTACRVEVSPPCVTCRSLRRDCTFTERARKKRKLGHQPTRQAAQSQGSGLWIFESL
jgi:hypothetical protein